MNNKQKSWLLVGPVIFSFAMAMTSPVVHIYFMRLIMNKERWETEPANLAAYTAVDVLVEYYLSRDKHCQDCVFNHEANMCELFSRIRQRTNKEIP